MLRCLLGPLGAGMVLWAWWSACSLAFGRMHPPTGPDPLLRWGIRASLAVARRLPARSVSWWLNLAAGAGSVSPTAVRILAVHYGFALLYFSIEGGRRPDLGDLLNPWNSSPGYYMAATMWSIGFFLILFGVQVARAAEAYRLRQCPISWLLGPRTQPVLAEVVLVDDLGTGSREELNRRFGELVVWFTEVERCHARFPQLALIRRADRRTWTDASVLMLDAAALALAAAPGWAPSNTYALVSSGVRCLQSTTAHLGIAVLPVAVSLHGREERDFADTFHYSIEGGLAVERSERDTWTAFQRLRTQYAPYAAAIDDVLLTKTTDSGIRPLGARAVAGSGRAGEKMWTRF